MSGTRTRHWIGLLLGLAVGSRLASGQGFVHDPVFDPPGVDDTVAAHAQLLASPDPALRAQGAALLGQIGPASIAFVPNLLACATDPSIDVAKAAIHALSLIIRRDDRATIHHLEDLACSANPAEQAFAAHALAALHCAEDSTAEVMIDLLEHPDFELQMTAIDGLWPTAGSRLRAVTILSDLITDTAEHEEVRIGACAVLKRFKSYATNALPALTAVLREPRVGAAAARAISRLGASGRPAADRLRGSFFAVVRSIAEFDHDLEVSRALDSLLNRTDFTPRFLGSMLDDENPFLRDEAAFQAGQLEALGRPLIPALVDHLWRDPAPNVRARCAAALGQVGSTSKRVTNELLAALRDPTVRFEAAVSLGFLHPTIDSSVAGLASDAEMPDQERAAILFAACRTDGDPILAAWKLSRILESRDDYARFACLAFLGVMRFTHPDGDVPIARLLANPSLELRWAAQWTVARIYPDPTARRRASLAAIEEAGLLPYWQAATGAWSITPTDWEFLTAVCDLRHRVRYHLPDARPLSPREPELPRTLDAVATAALSPSAQVRERAAQAAPQLGPSSVAALPALRDLLQDPSRRVRVAACQALARLGADAGEATPSLVAGLNDGHWTVRHAAVEALQQIRRGDPSIRAVLSQRATDQNAAVRTAVAAGLDPAPRARR